MYSTVLKKLLSLLTVFAMVFSMIAVVQPMKAEAAVVDRGITNGGFESGAFGGSVAGSNGAAVIEKATYEGNYALKFDAMGEILTVTGYLAEATTAESTVTLSFWAKVLGGSTGNSVNYGLFATNASWGNRVQFYGAGYPTVGGDWKQISHTMDIPAESKIIQAQINLGSEGTTAIIDNVSITDASGKELLHSGGFEKGALNDDFNANDALEIVCTPVHSGNYAAHADKSAGNGNITTTVSFEPSAEARTMSFSYWMYATNNVNSAHNMVVCFDTSTGGWTNLNTTYGVKYSTPGKWEQQTMEIPVVANTNTLQIQIYAQDEGADFYIDDLVLTEEVEDVAVNHDVTLSLNQVTGDGTWQFAISQAPANKYYKVPAVIDGVSCNILMGESGGLMCVYPDFFRGLGGAVPTENIIIEAGTVLKAVDNTNGWQEIEGADTLTVAEKIDLSYVNGSWSKTVYTDNVTLSLNQVTGDGTWQFSISQAPANKYYKVPAVIDGVSCNFLMGESGGLMCVYPNFFTEKTPAESLVIEAGTVLKAVDANNGWQEIEGANTLTITEKINLSCVGGVWGVTVPNQDVAIDLGSVQNDGTWQFIISGTPADKYYKVPAVIDGVSCNFLMGESGGLMCVYPNFFTEKTPAESLVIEAGTVMKAVDANNGWQEIKGAETLTVTNTLSIENNLGTWKDMSQYADVDFVPLTAADLDVYKTEDQASSQSRSVFAISSQVPIGNSGWGEFTKVVAKVLVDGQETGAVFGHVPTSDSSWGAESAFVLYITGNGYWDAATTASSVTICAGTKIMPSKDATTGFVFADDFVMYKNCDGSWDTTADIHLYNQQNTELEGALVSKANCQSAAVYKYSCSCGQLGNETFTYGELGDHNYVNGTCQHCADTIVTKNITASLYNVSVGENGATWQFSFSQAAENQYYKVPAIIDGVQCDVLMGKSGDLMCIYPNFFTALNGAVPAESFVIPGGTMLKAVDSNGWVEIEDATVLVVTEELRIENVAGKWVEMSKYSDVYFTEVYGADLDMYYYNILRAGDYSDAEINMMKLMYPEYASLLDTYGRDANMTTFGIMSNIPSLEIPPSANWETFTLLGTISVTGASPAETYVMQTPDSSDDAETAMDNGFLIRFYNGFVGDQATRITIEPGTKLVTKDGTTGFEFVDGYSLYRDSDGNWSDEAPEVVNPVNKWGLTLGEQIGVDFEMNVNEGDTVTFAVNGKPVSAEQNGNVYTVSVAAAQMNDAITVYINGVAQDKTYSVRGYADIILQGNYGDLVVDLVKAMLVYGGAAQTHFKYNASNLASNGVQIEAAEPAGEMQFKADGKIDGLKVLGATLVQDSKVAVRFYFTGSIDGATFTVNGERAAAKQKGDMYYVEVSGINPQQIADELVLVATKEGKTITVSYSALSYITRMYAKADTSDSCKAVVKALYNYYLAAVAYTA